MTYQIAEKGFEIIHDIYTSDEADSIISAINDADTTGQAFRKSVDLFAIRQFIEHMPGVIPIVFNEKLKKIIHKFLGDNYFLVKSIYFDKPAASNWYVSYHQDLTISVDKKIELKGFGSWTVKQNQFAVQPPVEILENITTIRIHLDDTDENNGALKVIPGSHLKKVCRPEAIDRSKEEETLCCVSKGGIMIMKPLIMHSSGRTANDKRRRVIHLEFSNLELPEGLQWSERMNFN